MTIVILKDFPYSNALFGLVIYPWYCGNDSLNGSWKREILWHGWWWSFLRLKRLPINWIQCVRAVQKEVVKVKAFNFYTDFCDACIKSHWNHWSEAQTSKRHRSVKGTLGCELCLETLALRTEKGGMDDERCAAWELEQAFWWKTDGQTDWGENPYPGFNLTWEWKINMFNIKLQIVFLFLWC